MILYFIRHGKSETYGTNMERSLTTEGKILLNEKFGRFKKILEAKENIKIFTSPLKRARQTGEILSEILEKDFEISEEVYSMNIIPFLKTLEKNNDYIIISHEPFISSWIREIAGKFQIVSRGSIHIIEMEEKFKGKSLREFK
ncbi:SixA phosphatase family protein [Peptoniphilus raoultii]|uniref:SixA phosphatase family protein n=1 Tax=Peptoniphilus raoultii TaxID=1776387 RepID=UPI0008DA7851|nr:phosphoglycerate mutase family protein [Peptoniphilus raoultii]